jgi:DNA replication protein DnaC
VLYYRTPELLRDLALETDGRKRRKLFQRLVRVPILMLDDFAAQKATTQQCFELNHLMDARQRRGLGVVVASPCDPGDWDRFFEDPTAADALFSRLHAKADYVVLKRKRPNTKR